MTRVGDPVGLSRTVSHALRHEPGAYGLVLDSDGWTGVDELLAALGRERAEWGAITPSELEAVLDGMPKRRHEIEGGRIRARYGHSVEVDPAAPAAAAAVPAVLFHGTTATAWESIQIEGLRPMARQRVHLSDTPETAERVGSRHGGDLVILAVDTAAAFAEGRSFWHVGDSTWQAEALPARLLRRSPEA